MKNKKSIAYSPSAIHSNSRTCPLRTIFELVEPVGTKNEGCRSSTGFSKLRTLDIKTQSEQVINTL